MGMGMQQQNMGGMPMQATVIDWNRGHLRIHPVECHLTHNTGGMMDKMDPFIFMRVGNLQEWRSTVCVDGGRNPRWGMHEHMQVECGRMQHKLHIEVRDKDVFGAEAIGHAEVDLNFFKRPNGHFNEAIELFWRGMPAGRLVVKTTYHPEAMTMTAMPYNAQPIQQQNMGGMGMQQNMGGMGNPGMGMNQGYPQQNMGMG